MEKRVTVAVAGIGGYGGGYLPEILKNGAAAELIACVDPKPDRCEHLEELRNRHVQVFPDLRSMYGKVCPDLVILATPIHMHCPQTCRALGKARVCSARNHSRQLYRTR